MFNNFNFTRNRDPFRLQVNTNLNESIKIFLKTFPRFDIKYAAYHRRKKKAKNQIPKEDKMKWKIGIEITNSIILLIKPVYL